MNPSRGVTLAGNWKMNHGRDATRLFFSRLGELVVTHSDPSLTKNPLRAALYIPHVHLSTALACTDNLKSGTRGLSITIGAQNAHGALQGAFTGETSGPMLKELGVTSVLIGHSERRSLFLESNELLHHKTHSLLDQGFQVLFCVGETKTERESDLTERVLQNQWEALFAGASAEKDQARIENAIKSGNFSLAYEPVWAIGTGLTATPDQANQAHQWLRGLCSRTLGSVAAERLSILYGGSVTPDNLAGLLGCSEIDGALVGGASLKPESFHALLKIAGSQS